MPRPGDRIADRFELELLAGRGGMGDVFRARDRRTHLPVALKVLRGADKTPVERFAREARMLSSLRHPAIVGYVDHGTTIDGERWLAMQWLEGEPLSARLSRAPLSVPETLRVLTRIAEALAAAHPLGIVHRDLKPSNIFLVHGEIERATVLDFGVARPLGEALVTATGVLVGTPTYMSPEQARRGKDVDARSDIFSLGCVAWACLTGRSPFSAPDVMTVLMKVMLEDPGELAAHRADIPPALDALVARMLGKSAAERPRDAAAVLEELREIDDAPAPSGVLSRREERVRIRVTGRRSLSEEPTHREDDPTVAVDRVGAAIADFDATFEAHPDGTFVATMRPGADSTVRAVWCARSMQAALGEVPLRITAGSGPLPTEGIAVDRELLGLIEHRFVVDGERVLAERPPLDAPRRPRGIETPFVGRERELSLLRALLDECIAERSPRAVVITGPPGVGKTRLVRELVASVDVDVHLARRTMTPRPADVPTLWIVDDVEGEIPTAESGPSMVIAIAREVTTRGDHLRLAELPRRVSERIAPYPTGNPLYLEEIVRSGGEALPLSVIALLQARFDALDTDARRLLRAASALGETFTRDELAVLVGAGDGVDAGLDALVARSLIETRGARFAIPDPLLREAAHRMLTVSDRALAAQALRRGA